ncbi:MAG: YybH family protein [Burkholderiales bacterium]
MKIKNLMIASAMAMSLMGAAGAAWAKDADVIAANNAFYAALSTRDVGAMKKLWSHDSDIQHISPFDKAPAVGWDAVQKDFEGTFSNLPELKVSLEHPHVKINGDTAWVSGIEKAQWKNKAGESGGGDILGTSIFVKQGGHWVMSYHHASMIPK